MSFIAALIGWSNRLGWGECHNSLQHLHAMIVHVTHKHAPVAINRNSTRAVEFPKAAAPRAGAYGPNVITVCAAHNLNIIATLIGNHDMTATVQRNVRSDCPGWAADAAQGLAAAVLQNMNAPNVADHEVAFRIESQVTSALKLPCTAASFSNGANVRAIAQAVHLQAAITIAVVNHDVAPAITAHA